MFGDLSGMMKKLTEAKQKVETTKKRLDAIYVDGSSNSGAVKVTVTANKQVKSIAIVDALLQDKEALEDYLILALNEALDKAGKISETELAAAAKDGLPNIPGVDFFK